MWGVYNMVGLVKGWERGLWFSKSNYCFTSDDFKLISFFFSFFLFLQGTKTGVMKRWMGRRDSRMGIFWISHL